MALKSRQKQFNLYVNTFRVSGLHEPTALVFHSHSLRREEQASKFARVDCQTDPLYLISFHELFWTRKVEQVNMVSAKNSNLHKPYFFLKLKEEAPQVWLFDSV